MRVLHIPTAIECKFVNTNPIELPISLDVETTLVAFRIRSDGIAYAFPVLNCDRSAIDCCMTRPLTSAVLGDYEYIAGGYLYARLYEVLVYDDEGTE